jgi:DNA-binding response OmpR family regulator
MSMQTVIFCADDDVMSDVILESLFADDYEVEFFTSTEGCLRRLEARRPDILLLNPHLPGKDGFSLCRNLKESPDTSAIPVVFISRSEFPEVRLAGYEAGGEDFIFKPYVIDEVRHRINHIRVRIEQQKILHQQLAGSEELTTLLLSNMDEYAALIKFMRTLNESEGMDDVAQAILGMLRGFRLQGAVQIRTPETTFTLSEAGRDHPMETAAIAHVARLDRIFQFKRCCAYNFEHLTVLVNNMPIGDADLCGRLRDHLAIGAEMADARIKAMAADRRFNLTQNDIRGLLPDIQQTLHEGLSSKELAHKEAVAHVQELIDQLIISFTPLGLSAELEEEITAMVMDKAQGIISVFNSADETTQLLERLEQRLRATLEIL